MVRMCTFSPAHKLDVTTDFIFGYFLRAHVRVYADACRHSCESRQVLALVCLCAPR